MKTGEVPEEHENVKVSVTMTTLGVHRPEGGEGGREDL